MPATFLQPVATGQVVDSFSRPVTGALVRVVWPRLRDELVLAETRTGQRGEFRVELKLPDDVPTDARVHVVALAASTTTTRPDGPARGSRTRRPAKPAGDDGAPQARIPALPLDELVGLTLRLTSAQRDEHSRLMTQARASLGGIRFEELREDDKQQDISRLAAMLGTPPEAAMGLVMAARVAERLDLPEPAVHALLADGASGLPSSLLDASDGFAMIDALTAHVADAISMVDPERALGVLKTAAERGQVPAALAGDAGKQVAERLRGLRDRQQLDRPLTVGKTPLGQLLEAGGLDAQRHALFLEHWRDNLGSAERFWDAMAEEGSGLKPDEVSRLKRTFDLGALVKNHLPMIEATRAQLGDDQPLSRLAALDADDWLAIVRKAGDKAVPPNILPGDGDSPQVLYAREIHERVQRRYPTTAIATRIAKKKLLPARVREPVARFFANSPELDLVTANLGTWLEGNAEKALDGIKPEAHAATLREVEKVQRVLRISRNVDAGEAMIDAGLDSAARFHALGRAQSVELLKKRGIVEFEANRLHDVAITRYANSTALLLRYNSGLNGIYPAATGPAAPFGEPLEAAIKRHPSLANLFGSQDACAVDPCTSILSASAYVSDLLLWLRTRRLRTPSPHANALAGLRARRADIPNLKLDCANTNTPLPYIDLVNELLEDAVSPPAAPLWRQTTRSAAELRAAPEYVNDSAYGVLATSYFPHSLPYDRAFDELSTVLAQSKVALWRARDAVLPATPTLAQRASVAAAAFGIPAAELALITVPAGPAPSQPLSVVWNTANPVVDLEVVGDFLAAAQITYDEMQQLLACLWPRSGGAAITISGVDDRCDSSTQRLVGLDATRLDRIHRFLRLWRRTGWAMWELDELIRAPAIGVATGGGTPTLDANAVVNLFTVWKLQQATGIDVEDLLAFWQDIGTSPHRLANGVIQPSLYARTFENPLLPPAPALQLATVLAAPPGTPIAPVLPAIRAALGLDADEAAALAAAVGATLNLQSLSAMVRATTLARELRISFDDLAYLAGGTLAGAFASPAATLALVERAGELAAAGADLPTVRHLLTRTPTAATRTQEQLADVLGAARRALQQINDDVRNSDESALAILQRQLGTLPSLRAPATLATAISIVDGRFAGPAGDRNAFIATHFGLFMPVAAAQAALALPLTTPATPVAPREAEIAARANALLTPLVVWLTEARIVSAVAGGFSISEPNAALLLRSLDAPGTTTRMLATLSDPLLIGRDAATGAYVRALTPADFPAAFNALRLLDKLAVPVKALKLSVEELEWQILRGSAVGGMSLAALPVPTLAVPAPADVAIDAWLATSRFVRLDRLFDRLRLTSTPPASGIRALRQLVEAVITSTLATDASVHAALGAIAGWPVTDVAAAAAAFGATSASGAWTNVSTYVAMHRLLSLAQSAGASVPQLSGWAGAVVPTQAQANEAWQALQSRYTHEAWLAVAPELMDPLRKRRRDALVWRLLSMRDAAGDPVWGFDTADLFARFLLDVQMSPCQVTTRIIQAYASIQLFVQRILMNLERDLEADPADEDWAQWQWMDRYRVWEAARKVFLYPENWLIEAQRPDRSEVFVAFDRDTQQREPTRDGLESAALGYLDRFAEVAQLQVTGLCSEPGTGNLYVLGRSPGDPITYYLRRFADRRWSSWEKVGVDITAHNAIPAFYAGRLHLFWVQPFIRNEPRQRLPGTEGATRDSEPVDRYIELRVYGTSLRDDVWQPPQMASSSFFDKPTLLSGEVIEEKDAEQFYTLKTQASGSSLLIDLFRVITPRLLPRSSPPLTLAIADAAGHIARAVFDGRFAELQLRDIFVSASSGPTQIVARAKALYGERAAGLVNLPPGEDEDLLAIQPGLRNAGGALVAVQRAPSEPVSIPLQLQTGSTTTLLLRNVPMPWRVVGLSNDLPFTPESPFVLSDAKRGFFVEPTRYWRNGSVWQTVPPSDPRGVATQLRFTFTRFYHPFVRTFRYVLSSQGFDGFFKPTLQVDPASVSLRPGGAPVDGTPFRFSTGYSPVSPIVRWGNDVDTVDFGYSAPYAGYNWEMFFHLPLFVGNQLSRNQRFDDARKWFHYIFDPTRVSATPTPQRYWITRPLSEQTDAVLQQQRINELLVAVNRRDPGALAQVERWRDDPFNPYLLADLRPAAHMKRVVMSYLDNLIAWGDSLFATASREALNEATLLYVMAAELLGPRPQLIPPPPRASASWNELEPQLDAFANALAAIENYVPAGSGGGAPGGGAGSPPLPAGQTFFFKIPPNDKLLAYWNDVEDRLFKLRHCRGLGGEALSLALFDAPIDPAMLVRAGGDQALASALSEMGAAPPNYRFFEMHRRAVDFTQAVIDLGRDLLSALESRDAEALAVLLAEQKRRVHGDAEQVLKWQLDEAKELKKALEYAIELEDYRIQSAADAELMSGLEITSVTMKSYLVAIKLAGMVKKLISGGLSAIPNFLIGAAGVGGSPQAGATTGGPAAATIVDYGAEAAEKFLQSVEKGADLIKVFAEAEKALKAKKKDGKLAEYDKKRLGRELEAADLRMKIAEYHLEQFGKAADDLDAERDYLSSKFSSEALYDWMVGELSNVYFRAFKLAVSMARRAERCYRFELGMLDSNVVGPSSWDSLRRGLLAGENLAHDLRRLESSYLDLNVRRKETTRTISLRKEFPAQLFTLLSTGTCNLSLNELLFDRDYPGHYQRRIVRASISVQRPDADPHDNVVCVATLVSNSVRLSPALGAGYPRLAAPASDARFADQFAPVQGIVTGNAIEDPGLFVRDIAGNLADPRYLPFENAGAIGTWKLDLPASRNTVDLATVTDVKLHLHYSALDGGEPLANAAQAVVDAAAPSSMALVFDAATEFPEAWEAFLAATSGEQRFRLPLRKGLLPPVARNRTVVFTSLRVHVLSDHGGTFDVELLPPLAAAAGQAAPVSPGAVLSTATFSLPSPSMRDVAFRLREQGAADWASLARDRVGAVLVELQLGLS